MMSPQHDQNLMMAVFCIILVNPHFRICKHFSNSVVFHFTRELSTLGVTNKDVSENNSTVFFSSAKIVAFLPH